MSSEVAVKPLDPAEIEQLRRKHYNAAVHDTIRPHDELLLLRVRPDGGVPRFEAGQYTTLGLGNWEPRAPDTQPEDLKPGDERKVVKRAYSLSSPLVDERGELWDPVAAEFLEFYVVLVRNAQKKPPALTPRLFMLKPGERLFVGPKITGHYTLKWVRPEDDVLLLSTGTGEAPHNAMLVELLRRGHRGRIVGVCCVRHRGDLAYLSGHEALARRYANYTYIPLTTREPENLDPNHPGYVGKYYIQDLVSSGKLEERLGRRLDPERCHVFLCGNPQMIGIPEKDGEGRHVYPKPTGVIEVLEARGFRCDEPGRPGNIHFEKYW